MKKNIILFFFLIALVSGCSSSEETTLKDNKEKEYYVFDDVKNVDSIAVKKDTIKISPPPVPDEPKIKQQIDSTLISKIVQKYIVQIGAYSTKERAQKFIIENQSKVDFKMEIKFNGQTNLYVIQSPQYSTREEAENVRNNLWLNLKFKDAFIITE